VTVLAHLSDLHFGREDATVVAALREELLALGPALVAVSGDLTQRARRSEFERAREFLDSLPGPRLVVPGNHDIPLFDVVRRVLRPLGRYQRHVTADMEPFVELPGLVVLGVNTARPSAWKDGRLSLAQVERIRERFCGVEPATFKALVTHHPFLPPPHDPKPALVGRGLAALAAAEQCGVDLLLAGHLHLGYTGDVRAHHVTVRRSILVAQAGTATSRRTRGEPNGYNVVRIQPPLVEIEARTWAGLAFVPARTARFARSAEGWRTLG
jgi:3',5'-cyclic AMP phosphodiesterase CpdA